MNDYAYHVHVGRKRRRALFAALISLLIIVTAGALVAYKYYEVNLAPYSADAQGQEFVIEEGATVQQIAQKLEQAQIIRNQLVFEVYARAHGVSSNLQAGTYMLRSNMSTEQIVAIITSGKVVADLFTILPGQRIDQIRQSMIDGGFPASSVDVALDALSYQGHPALADLPEGASLEGYLYPDSFERTASTKPETIIRQSLDLMANSMTTDIRQGLRAQGLSAHQGVIVASIVEKEVSGSNPQDRPMVARVFLNRIAQGMQLGSDVTSIYGAIVAGKDLSVSESIGFDSPYNTRMHGGLPPGPISNVSHSSLSAVASPAENDYLYFVAGDDGNTYFARTYDQHMQNVQAHCHELCNL